MKWVVYFDRDGRPWNTGLEAETKAEAMELCRKKYGNVKDAVPEWTISRQCRVVGFKGIHSKGWGR